ncbi:DUF4304 domain-containing protein [Mucilaginibacter flavidus]|uniref:DUF4304 domain-containing protein n=1 Tax=Mucilaginibacter flavidus TaxID=2949309 RepID=UPI00209286F1|nr:DUF4304 domain-containing protein [Mucilaginibacter flavidus]MCO5947724.1 DUF4304 domain-containing protein [Mucilaginibacter flavidus]
MGRDLTIEFQTIIKTVVSPLLKRRGFKKKNFNYNRAINGLVQSINIQRSQYNHSESISFTINLGFYNSRIFQISKNRLEPQFVTSDNCFVWGRSGMLIYNKDYWYKLNLNDSYNLVLLQVENDFNNHIIPLFAKLDTLTSIIEFSRIDYENRPFRLIANIDEVSILELEYGDFDRGKDILSKEYNKAIIPKSTKHTTVYPDGREEIRWSEPGVNKFHIELLQRIANNYGVEL